MVSKFVTKNLYTTIPSCPNQAGVGSAGWKVHDKFEEEPATKCENINSKFGNNKALSKIITKFLNFLNYFERSKFGATYLEASRTPLEGSTE